MEPEHDGNLTLAIVCVNAGQDVYGRIEHRMHLVPVRPAVRKLVRKIDARSDLELLATTLRELLENSLLVDNVTIGDGIH